MANTYEITCDFCGAKVYGSSEEWRVKTNNWSVSITNHWFEPAEGSDNYKLVRETEISKDACWDCAKKIASLINGEMTK